MVTVRCLGRYVLLTDADGRRHAVREAAVLALHDADDGWTSTAVTMTGGRIAIVEEPLDAVLAALQSDGRSQR